MGEIEAKLEAMGLTLPAALQPPPGMKLPFAPVRVRGNRAWVSGHSPQNADGSVAMTGKLGVDLSVEQGYEAARLTVLAMLGSIQRALGGLDRVAAWLKVLGDGQLRARLHADAQRRQRLLRPHHRVVGAGARRARPLRRRDELPSPSASPSRSRPR